jgi:predicted Na+-dependent transporter
VPVLVLFAMVTVGLGLTTIDFRRVAREPGTFVVATAQQFLLLPRKPRRILSAKCWNSLPKAILPSIDRRAPGSVDDLHRGSDTEEGSSR